MFGISDTFLTRGKAKNCRPAAAVVVVPVYPFPRVGLISIGKFHFKIAAAVVETIGEWDRRALFGKISTPSHFKIADRRQLLKESVDGTPEPHSENFGSLRIQGEGGDIFDVDYIVPRTFHCDNI